MVRNERVYDEALQTGAGASPLPARPLGDFRFRALMGAGQWASLPPAVRWRFSKRLAGKHSAVYRGEITETHINPVGWLLARVARLVGGPLPLHRETGTPATVVVTEDPASSGQFWTRVYGRQNGFPQVIHSSKRFAGPTGLEEYLGRGVGMALTAHGDRNGLRFRSVHYFIQLFGRRLALPGWASPGQVTVSHIDRGKGRFAFELELRHPWFGVMIRQTAMFRDEAGEEGL
jgi:hypothetical protein